MQQHNVIYIMG